MKNLKNRVVCLILLLALVCWARGDLAVIKKVFEKSMPSDSIKCPPSLSTSDYCVGDVSNKTINNKSGLNACLLIRYDTAFTKEHCVYWLYGGQYSHTDFDNALQFIHSAKEVLQFLLPYNYDSTTKELSFAGLDKIYLAFNENDNNNQADPEPLASFPMFDQTSFDTMPYKTFKIRSSNDPSSVDFSPLHVGINNIVHETLQVSGWGLFVKKDILEDITMILITLEQDKTSRMMRFELLDGPTDTQVGYPRVQYFPFDETKETLMSYSYKEESVLPDQDTIKFELYGLNSFMNKEIKNPFIRYKATASLTCSSPVALQKVEFGDGKTIKSLFDSGHRSLLLMMQSKTFSLKSIKGIQALCGGEINISFKIRKSGDNIFAKITSSQTCRVDMWKLVTKTHQLPFASSINSLNEAVLKDSEDSLAKYIKGCEGTWSRLFSVYKQYLIPSSLHQADNLALPLHEKFEWLKSKPEPTIQIEQNQTYFCLPINSLNQTENTEHYCPTNLKLYIKRNKDLVKLKNACYKFDGGEGEKKGYTFRLPSHDTGVYICTDFDSLFVTHVNFHTRARQKLSDKILNHQRIL